MAKDKTKFVCTDCGYDTIKWLGKCPSCQAWGTLKEFKESKIKNVPKTLIQDNKPIKLKDIKVDKIARIQTNISELDRVMGGGILSGMVTLIGGDPGLGKSTLMLQLATNLNGNNISTLYVSGEESLHQIKHRSQRIDSANDSFYIFCENNLEKISAWIEDNKPEVVIIDSIQTVYDPNTESTPGSVGQIRSAAARLVMLAKQLNISFFLVGHVTKDGAIAGPKIIEHMVDTVLYFEGDRYHRFRILRTIKNRFGSTNEIGMFEMRKEGLIEVTNPSQYFLNDESTQNTGTSITASMEGTRPFLIEIQALVSDSNFGNPQRNCVGFDIKRLSKILAVLDKKIGMHISNQDVFLNVTGGGKLNDPGADMSVAMSLISSFRNIVIPKKSIFCGEVGLNGEIRAVNGIEQRINESIKLGFENIFIPKANKNETKKFSKQVTYVSDLNELLSYIV
ncbi:MAG: DNA repair protein RadA [Candidatus Delongbacteria bacterium]|nr:DNA repair protein RadA [Candidatus Delongbacteria bacterium]